MIWYFYQSQNRLQKRKKKKGKIKQKREKPYLAPRRNRPTQPTRPTRGRGVFFHLRRPQAARWNATELAGDATSPPSAFQAAPCLFSRPGDPPQPPQSIPLSLDLLPLSSSRVLRRPRVHRSAPPWKPVATFLLSRCH